MTPVFFANTEELRAWFLENHASASVLLLGYYKKDSGRFNYSWSDTVDEALCFGWIDGVRRSIDAESYCIRFTPRKPKSIWSAVNLKKVEVLRKAGRMHEAGLTVWKNRDPAKSGVYSFEREQVQLDPAYEAKFRKNAKAWAFFESRPPSYRKPAIWWVMSAKQEATRLRRLAALIADSAAGRKVKPLRRPGE